MYFETCIKIRNRAATFQFPTRRKRSEFVLWFRALNIPFSSSETPDKAMIKGEVYWTVRDAIKEFDKKFKVGV